MLVIHRAARADALVAGLAALLAEPLPGTDPMVPDVVAVPTKGIERWVSQRLSITLGASPGRGDGVCANVHFPFPGRVIGAALGAASGIDGTDDPWSAERAAWPLLEVVDACLDEDWLAPLAAHLGGRSTSGEETAEVDVSRRTRRFSTVRHVAGLYDRYGVHRPEMLAGWAAGSDTDGDGRPLPAGFVWQAELWRRLRVRIGVPSPAERLDQACDTLRADPALAAPLPARFSLFGLTRLPASHLCVLDALAARRDVHLFLLHPSPVLWERIAALHPAGAVPRGTPLTAMPVRRGEDSTSSAATHPLLASWGRDAREMQLVLGAAAHRADDPPAVTGTPRGENHRAPTLLQRLQDDIRADQAPPGEPLPGQAERRALLAPADRSISVHACHGRARQVEVMRDAILGVLAQQPDLEPRDVIVMCPDIEVFAPLIHATFGTDQVDDPGVGDESRQHIEAARGMAGDVLPPDLRVRLADRSLRQTNPVLGVVAALVELASARLTAAQVLDLAGREPVRRRFGFDDDELARVEEWVADVGIRWGLDAADRAPFRLEAVAANTWRAGLDRILLGVAMADEGERLLGGVLPLDDVGSGDIDLAGRFAEFLDRLEAALRSLRDPQPLGAWVDALGGAVSGLTATARADAWQSTEARRLLEDVLAEATSPGRPDGTVASGTVPSGTVPSGAALSLVELRALLADRLRGRPTRANFRTGHLTVCTLVPMRSVPHRVVCLLGLDDGSFPRRTVADGDDLVAADPRVGDRDVRSEERQLLLDALMAATDHLIVTFSGRDERTNGERPPAVPVGELLDVVDRTVRTEDGVDARDKIVVHHPLQPFDPRNFTAGALVPGRAWSFDPVALAGAAALGGTRRPSAPFLDGPLVDVATDPVEIEALVRFVGHPAKAFLRQRLGIGLTDAGGEASASMPIELDALERWQVGQRLLEGRLTGAPMDACVNAERARGTLPPDALADAVLARVVPTVEGLAREAAALSVGPDGQRGAFASVDVYLRLPDGRSLVGTVSPVVGDRLLSVTYSAVAPKHRLAAWARFLAVNAAHPERRWEAAVLGRSRFGAPRGTRITTAHVRSLGADPETRHRRAMEYLAVLVDLYDRGLREALPLFAKTSAAWAEAVATRRQPEAKAVANWESSYERAGEDADAEHELVFGGRLTFREILGLVPAKDEEGDGWPGEEQSRFGRYARRLWDPLLSTEEVVDS